MTSTGDDMLPETLAGLVEATPDELTENERTEWLNQLKGVAVSSDAFFPFRDNIDRVRKVSLVSSHSKI